MVFSACPCPKMTWTLSQTKQKDGISTHYPLSPLFSSSLSSSPSSPYNSYSQKDSTSSSSGTKISPAVLFIIVIVAVIFFISGLLHLIVRFLFKHRSSTSHSHLNRYPEISGSETFQRQLQQLFHLHDSGLDQAFIDALPVFHYKEIVGLKEPFDCAVCLCEFLEQDKLRLLPMCSHAFHINCIDTWLLSNSTCPICRGSLYTPGLPVETPVFYFEDSREEVGFSGNTGGGVAAGPENEIISGKRVFSVRLGKYRSINNEAAAREGVESGDGEGETSSSNLDARRCYSMGSFQYVVANSDLQVTFSHNKASGNGVRFVKGMRGVQNENSSIDGDCEGKKINIGSKGDSFSVSKIWLWSKKSKFPSSSDTHMSDDVSLP